MQVLILGLIFKKWAASEFRNIPKKEITIKKKPGIWLQARFSTEVPFLLY
jgi:hypothetical protein